MPSVELDGIIYDVDFQGKGSLVKIRVQEVDEECPNFLEIMYTLLLVAKSSELDYPTRSIKQAIIKIEEAMLWLRCQTPPSPGCFPLFP